MKRITILTTAIVLLAFLTVPLGMRGQAPVNTVLWEETWTGGTIGVTPSAYGFEGTTVYDGATLTYNQSATGTKLYDENLAGGTAAPELLLSKSNQTWTISNIPTGEATGMSLTFKSNKTTFAVTTTTSGITISGSQKSWTINVTGSAANFDLTIQNTGSQNARIDDIELKVTTAGAGSNTVATPSITPNGGDFLDSQEVSITCATEGATIYYTTNGNDPTTASTPYSAPFTITSTTTVKAIAVKSGLTNSTIATAEFVKVTPMTVAEARAAIDAGIGTQGVYVTGIVSSIVTPYGYQGYSNISFNFSDDGETSSDQLEAFRCVSTEGADASMVVVSDIVVVYGDLTLYNNTTYEFTQGCQLVSLTHTTPFVETPVFSPEAGTYTEAQTVTITCATEGSTIYYTTDGTDPNNGSTLYSNAITVSETTTIKAIAYDANNNSSAISTATYTIQAPAPMQTFSKTEGHYPVEGQTYLIVDLNSGKALTSANGASAAPTAVEVTITDDQITTNETDLQWTFEAVEGGYIIHPVGDDTKWLYTTDANNGVRVGTNSNNIWTLNVTDETNTNYLGFMNNAFSRYLGVYNNADWRTYTSVNNNIKNTQIALFVLGEAPVVPSFTIENNNEIAYNATSGSFDFTVNHPVEGGTTTVVEEVDWISNAAISGNSVTFTTTVNEAGTARHGVITLTYTYNRATVTKDVTVTQLGNPNTTMTIAEVREQGTGNVVTTGTVTSCVGTTGYIQDATAAICVYGAELTVGDQIRVEGTLSTYHGLLEITSPVVTVLSSGNTVEPELMTIAEINESTNQGWYVRIEEATVTAISGQNTTIAQGDNTIVVRGISGVEYAVNDLLTLNGNIGCYDAAQIANPQNVEVQQSTEPAITVTPATVNVTAEETTGTLTVTYVEVNEAEAEVYFCGADGMPVSYDWIIADLDADNNVEYVIEANEGEARTAYLMVVVGEIASNLVTINQAEYVTPALGYAELPFAFDGGKADIETTDGLTQNGLGSDYSSSPKLKFDSADDWMILHFNEEPGQFSFVIKGTGSPFSGTFTVETSVDGVEYETLATYTELGDAETMTFTTLDADVRYIRWYFTEKVSGCNVGIGDIHLYKVGGAPASITVDPATVNATAAETEGTLTVTYTNITNIVAEVFFCNAEGEAEEYDWIFADIDNDNNIEYLIDANPANARTAYLKVYALDDDAHEVYSNLVTINQDAYVAPFTGTRYNMITTTANIESGRHYIIAGWKDNQAYAMGLQNGNNRAAVAINIDNDGWAYVDSSDVYEFVINGPDADGNYFFYDTNEASTGYLYAASSGSNHLKTEEFLDALGNGLWSIEIAEIGNAATVIAQGDHERNWMRFNSNNNPPIFSCYGSTSNQKDIYLFVKEEDETFEFFKDIVGFGEGNGDWHLVATPFDDVEPEDANMPAEEAEEYDLYWFNTTATGEEWRNYKTAPFNLYMGKGYLYASKSPVTLHFEGDEILGEGNEEVTLEYEGFNLVGNPFARLATVDADFYVMSDGYEIAIADRDYVKPMEGIFVEAATQGQSVTFSSLEVGVGGNEPDQQNKLNIRVTDNNGNSDIARIRFGEGRGLEKLMLNENHNKLYFVVDGNEYAVTYAANKGEMPVYFKAAEDGTYTLTVSATLNSQLSTLNSQLSTLNFKYLHLIDNLTGAEVDLLVNPSYSFEARTTDNAARFRLVFSK